MNWLACEKSFRPLFLSVKDGDVVLDVGLEAVKGTCDHEVHLFGLVIPRYSCMEMQGKPRTFLFKDNDRFAYRKKY